MGDACRLLRILVLGKVGNENAWSVLEEEEVFLEAIGSKENVFMLHCMWAELVGGPQVDHTERVDLHDFRKFVISHLRENPDKATATCSATGMDLDESASRLCDKVERLLLNK